MSITIKDNLIKELGLDNLDEDVQADILSQMTEAVLKRIAVNVLEGLSEEGREEFVGIQEEGSPEKMEEFLSSKSNNYEKLINDTVLEFKTEIKESIENIKKTLN